jgi:curved DNA-binding protein CbpA
MSDDSFIDYYETLQVSPNADTETIVRVYRHLAKRYHPDNTATGDGDRFHQVMAAHDILTDPEKRAGYDVRYQQARANQLEIKQEAFSGEAFEDDNVVRGRILAVLFSQRRRDLVQPALGDVQLEELLSFPREYLGFHIWYLKEKGWIVGTDRGVAITAAGVDGIEAGRQQLRGGRLLTERAEGGRPAANVNGSGESADSRY